MPSTALSTTRIRSRKPYIHVVVQEDVVIKNSYRVRVIQREYAHDMAAVTVDRDRKFRTGLLPGQPVRIRYGRDRTTQKNFFGYIHHIEPEGSEEESPRLQTIHCIGTSMRMKQKHARAWKNVYSSSVVRKVLTSYRVNSDLTLSSRREPMITQTGESDWSLCTRLAKAEGYTFFVNRTTGTFRSRTKYKTSLRTQAPLFRRNTLRPERNDILSFAFLYGLDTGERESANRSRSANGVNARTGQIIVVRETGTPEDALGVQVLQPFFHEIDHSMVLDSVSEGKEALKAQSRTRAFPVRATARMKGDAGVSQGRLICIDGINDNCNGYWYVEAVEHEFRRGDLHYDIEVVLGRDAMKDDKQRPEVDPDAPLTRRPLAARDAGRNALGEVVYYEPRTLFIRDTLPPIPVVIPGYARGTPAVDKRSWGEGGASRFQDQSPSNARPLTGTWVSEWVSPPEDEPPHEC